MGYLIPVMTLKQLQAMTADKVKNALSVIVTDEGGEYLGNLIVPQTDFIKTQAEYMSELSNGVKPKADETPTAEGANGLKPSGLTRNTNTGMRRAKP